MKISLHVRRMITALLLLGPPLWVTGQNELPVISDSVHSAILDEMRELRVILPREYQPGSAKRYEVLYILDGEWCQDLVPFTYNFAASAGYLPQSIFVLVRNRYNNDRNLRDRDFSPTPVPGDPVSGGADRFYDFLTKEVVPYIERKYPANGERSLLGASFSGLFSIYAFLKAPAFFQSFIASDPNLNFDKYYMIGLAARQLPTISGSPGTLFIAGRTNSYHEVGIFAIDSVLQQHAPANLRWRCIRYDDETHYSVQLKAYYDGFRFSHNGYGQTPPEFHPQSGMVAGNHAFRIYSLNDNTAVRFTIDGTAPTPEAPIMVRNTTFAITSPGRIRIKRFANRPAYTRDWIGDFSPGQLLPGMPRGKKVQHGLTYKVFDGTWDTIPNTAVLTPSRSGPVDSLFKLKPLVLQRTAFLLMEGTIDIPEDAEYVFYVNGYSKVRLMLGGKTLIKATLEPGVFNASYIVSLAKGKYPLRLELLHNIARLEPNFFMYRSRSGADHWLENPVLKF